MSMIEAAARIEAVEFLVGALLLQSGKGATFVNDLSIAAAGPQAKWVSEWWAMFFAETTEPGSAHNVTDLEDRRSVLFPD